MDSSILEYDPRDAVASGAMADIALARSGSVEALGELLETCRGYLLAVSSDHLDKELRVKFTASDIVQETFLEAHRDFQQFRGASQAELLVWLRRILLNNIHNLRRHYRTTQKRSVMREERLDERLELDSQAFDGVVDAATPSKRLMAEEDSQRVEAALGRLAPTQRQVILLRNYLRWSFAEIAAFLGRTPEASRKYWARSIERLQHELERDS